MGNKYLYIATSWQGFIQQIVLLTGSGYRHYCFVNYPEHKQDKFTKIDKKLIRRYETDMQKNQLWRNKKEGNANFKFLRYENMAIILMATNNFQGRKTQTKEGVEIDDDFLSIDKKPLILEFGKETSLKVHSVNGKMTMSMSSLMYKNKKAELLEVAAKKSVKLALYEFGKLNGIPTYSGNFNQRKELLDILVDELKRHNVKVFKNHFYIKNQRTKFKVFD
uniref:hypothetical protein n=1 Tax=Planococcus sp. (in: firmicutes) TaxID=1871321 RepID=UPI00159788B3|nr:hypothetical protein [Planococcus sp. (in: firmicutes)]QJS06174.1 hypothetical protein [Planococcus sp. (in: firmicutes)]